MSRSGERLFAVLPHFPRAGKIEYTVRLSKGLAKATLPSDGSAILRYRDDVPGWLLVLHIAFMFAGLLLGLRLLASALLGERGGASLFPWLMALMVPGGLVLGPLVQKYAFGAYWTGWPVGEDLTDTKTLVAVLAWVGAWWISTRRPDRWRAAVVVASVVMLAVYLIPHSVRGSQIDWSTVPNAPIQPATGSGA